MTASVRNMDHVVDHMQEPLTKDLIGCRRSPGRIVWPWQWAFPGQPASGAER